MENYDLGMHCWQIPFSDLLASGPDMSLKNDKMIFPTYNTLRSFYALTIVDFLKKIKLIF
ncbi:hypothetical protein LM7416_110085 [Listeria monocytogenes]|nr:hypothetical protein LM500065_140061 [Listeria monocytogenes]CUL17628.1 hypothetical protein LM701345_90085 [Listeria monocytogenes]CUL21324.1 hypothetical protein LM7414_110083 [Listeria monocytogenes]CUL22918.1 hypothetical protein LM7416_110085 [Listeria monocytogenes]CUL33445.1 hypothetical protein LM7420_190086 [Listeria monocytogenes]